MNEMKETLYKNIGLFTIKHSTKEGFKIKEENNHYVIKVKFNDYKVSKIFKKEKLMWYLNIYLNNNSIDMELNMIVASHFDENSKSNGPYDFSNKGLERLDKIILNRINIIFNDLLDNIDKFTINSINNILDRSIKKTLSKKQLKLSIMETRLKGVE